jgi:hypothetical protein
MSRSNPEPREEASVFVPSDRDAEAPRRRWPIIGASVVLVAAIVAVGIMVAWPRLKPRPIKARQLDTVERVASDYLRAISTDDSETLKSLGTVEEPPAIRSVRSVTRNPRGSRQIKGSFAPLGKLHARIASEYVYDADAGLFTPKNALGPAAQTLDMLTEAKDEAEKSGMYKKMESGDPNDVFDAVEQFAKVYTQLNKGPLSSKKLVPTYKMLIDESKPPLPEDAKALALEISPADWSGLLKRSFHTLKADGPFIFVHAEVSATATDRLASSGDPPTKLALTLIRFRLEAIDSGWKVVSIRRILPGEEGKQPAPPPSSAATASKTPPTSPGDPPRSLHDDAPANQ